MWRACCNVLPTKSNLTQRKVQIDPKCSFCNQQDETKEHILWECPFAHNVWALVRGKLQKSSSVAENFSCLHVIWWRGLTERSSSCGLWRRGLSGTLIAASILNMFKPTRVRSLNKPTPYMKNIKGLPSPFPTDEISAYLYTLFFLSFGAFGVIGPLFLWAVSSSV